MKKPTISIIADGPRAKDVKVLVDGKDITGVIRDVTIELGVDNRINIAKLTVYVGKLDIKDLEHLELIKIKPENEALEKLREAEDDN